jgi:methylenetetrahydrofolate--tRNA-(uracil-5-)-methyltransferase
LIPGLANAEFIRLGVMHRNTYIDSPRLLDTTCNLAAVDSPVFIAGQLTGVEGYVESGAIGILAGLNAGLLASGRQALSPPRASAFGCLVSHITNADTPAFSPMNINWGLFPESNPPVKDKGARRMAKLAAARDSFAQWNSLVQSAKASRTEIDIPVGFP